mmetsp:Transcript_3847/g.5374  ORF Transcript_3847/g.5374 Transcript_3847/m.5374 type:complete len:146 (+) Transcript_3847:97-534(+)
MADVSDSALSEAYQEVRSDKTNTNWCLFGYEGNAKIVLQGKGEGGLEELVGHLQADQAQFGYLRVISGDNESKRAKFVLLTWCGQQVGALKRAKISVHKASVKTILKDFAVEVQGDSQDDFTEEIIMQRVRKAGGADYSGNVQNQ